jgi:hypothetical protein
MHCYDGAVSFQIPKTKVWLLADGTCYVTHQQFWQVCHSIVYDHLTWPLKHRQWSLTVRYCWSSHPLSILETPKPFVHCSLIHSFAPVDFLDYVVRLWTCLAQSCKTQCSLTLQITTSWCVKFWTRQTLVLFTVSVHWLNVQTKTNLYICTCSDMKILISTISFGGCWETSRTFWL